MTKDYRNEKILNDKISSIERHDEPNTSSLHSDKHSSSSNSLPSLITSSADVQYPELRITTLAFGSCHKSAYVIDETRTIWDAIGGTLRPDAFLWTGDAIYPPIKGLSSPQTLLTEYQNMLHNHTIGYSRFLSSATLPSPSSFLHGGIHGTWDDHDYGGNDYGDKMPQRRWRQRLYLDFLHASSPSTSSYTNTTDRYNRDGVYYSVTYGTPPFKTKLIFLDTRWERSSHHIPSIGTTSFPLGSALACLTRWITAGLSLPSFFHFVTSTIGGRSKKRVLSEAQWEWLEGQLKGSDAQVHVVVSSIQVLTTNPFVESWGHFPEERMRLLRILNGGNGDGSVGEKGGGVEGLILLSGDVHHAEILDASAGRRRRENIQNGSSSGIDTSDGDELSSEEDWVKKGRLLEVTSSGMTHSCRDPFYGRLCGPILDKFPEHRFDPADNGVDVGTEPRHPSYYTGKNFGSIEIDWGTDRSNEKMDYNSGDGLARPRLASMRISVHDERGNRVLTTGSHPLTKYMSRMSHEELELVSGCIDGHLLHHVVKILVGLFAIAISFRFRCRSRPCVS